MSTEADKTQPWDGLPWAGLARAAFSIAIDNGGINRLRSVAQWRREFLKWAAKRPDDMLRPIDQWLAALTDEQMETVCCGEASETEAALVSAPAFTDDLLNDYFDEVC